MLVDLAAELGNGMWLRGRSPMAGRGSGPHDFQVAVPHIRGGDPVECIASPGGVSVRGGRPECQGDPESIRERLKSSCW